MFIKVRVDCHKCVTATEFVIPEEVSDKPRFDPKKYMLKVMKDRGWKQIKGKDGKIYWSCVECEKEIRHWALEVKKNKSKAARRKHGEKSVRR